MTTGDAIAATCARIAVRLTLRDLARARAANDNGCAPCREARQRGAYVCPLCAGREVLW